MHDTYAKFRFQIQIQIMCHTSNDESIYNVRKQEARLNKALALGEFSIVVTLHE